MSILKFFLYLSRPVYTNLMNFLGLNAVSVINSWWWTLSSIVFDGARSYKIISCCSSDGNSVLRTFTFCSPQLVYNVCLITSCFVPYRVTSWPPLLKKNGATREMLRLQYQLLMRKEICVFKRKMRKEI